MRTRRPMIEIFRPVQQGNQWLVAARIQTSAGPVNIMASAERPVIGKAFEVLEGYLQGQSVGGFFDDAFKAVKSVVQHPLVKQIASYIPYVGTAVAVADTAFSVADGLMKKSPKAAQTVRQLQQAATGPDPQAAAKAKAALERVKVAKAAQAAAKDPAKVAQLKQAAAAGKPGAQQALTAIHGARRWELGQLGAGVLKRAAAGDARATARLDEVRTLAAAGDPAALELIAVMDELVQNARTAAAEDQGFDQADEVGALTPAGEAAFIARMRQRARRRRPGVHA